MPARFKNQKGFSKLLLIPGIIILLIVLFILQDRFLAPPDKRGGSHRQLLVSQSNRGIIPKLPQTNYKNNLVLHWVPVDWTKVISSSSMMPETNTPYPAITQNVNVYSAQDITYCTAGNTGLKLDLYSSKPTVPGQLKPMAVYVFGGGLVDGDKRELYADSDRVLLSLINDGFLVASINYRLAPQYKYPAMIRDVLCSVRFLKYYSYGIGGNQNRIGLLGGSVGGQLVQLAGITTGTEAFENSADESIAGANLTYRQYLSIPTKPQAVVTYYGGGELPDSPLVIFLVNHLSVPLPGAPHGWHDTIPGSGGKNWSQGSIFNAVYNSDPTLMHEASASHYVTAGEPSFLIVQGDKDGLAPPQQAADLYAKLKSFNNNARLVMVKNADHSFIPNPPDATIDPSLESIINTTVDFFKSY